MNNELKPVQCGCGGETDVHLGQYDRWFVFCESCGTRTCACNTRKKAIEVWNRAMSGKDINVPNKERTAKVISYDEIITVNGYRYHYEEYLCNACKKKVFSCDSYCSSCGAKLDWSGNE